MSKKNEKIIIDCVKKIAKKNYFKTISNCIYKIDENLVIYAVLWVTNQNSIKFRWCIKTVELDDIFWDIFDMAENKNERFSLRIIGAFCCPSYTFDETIYKIENRAVLEEQVNSFFLSELDKVEEYIKDIRANYDDFLHYVIEREDADDLTKLLAYVLLGKYEYVYKVVKSELKKGENGGFGNRGKNIYEYMKEYCWRKIRPKL
jgi:hypothetical protein